MDPRRSLPAARVGQQGRNRGLARNTIRYFLGTGYVSDICFGVMFSLLGFRCFNFCSTTNRFLWERKGYPDEEYTEESLSKYDRPKLCEVCMKVVVDHLASSCPFLLMIQNPENTPVGEGYKILCHCCSRSDHGHPDGSWTGFAINESWSPDGSWTGFVINESWSRRNAHFVQISDAAVNCLRRIGPQSRI
ncbi:hypothetical protein ACLB2K_040977 [Fragaria x ananassa]